MDEKIMNRKAQVTVFVIVGIIIVVVLSMLLVLTRNDVDSLERDFDNPESYLSLCVKERASEVIKEMLAGGGFIGKSDTILYRGEKVTYLCKNINYFEPCINQYPVYVTQVEKEFNEQINDDVNECFESLKQSWQDKGYEFKYTPLNFEADLKPGIIEISLKSNVSISKKGVSRTYDRFDTFVYSRIYDLALIVSEIINNEAKYCYFDNDKYMLNHRDYDVIVQMLDDTTKIYTIKNKITNEKLSIASRGCAMPAGAI